MLRFLFVLALLAFIGCSDDDSDGKCTCTAQFSMCAGEVQTFPGTEIDCETGELIGFPVGDPCASFIGCLD